MAKVLTRAEIKEALEDIVAEKGEDWKSGYCVYSNDAGAPVCLLGHMVERLDPDAFTELTLFSNRGKAFDLVVQDGIVRLDPEDETLAVELDIMQDHQDCGFPWGQVLRRSGL